MGIRSAVIAVSMCGPILTGGAALAQSQAGSSGGSTSTTVVTPPTASKSSPKVQSAVEQPNVPGVVIVTRPPVRREVEAKAHRVSKRGQKKEEASPPVSAAGPAPAQAGSPAAAAAGAAATAQPNAGQIPAPSPGHPQKAWPLVTGAGAAAAQAAAQQPAPDLWSEAEIKQAKTYCESVLKGVDAAMTPEDPIKEGECGSPVVYRVSSISKGPAVEISPPVVLTCDMVATLDRWIKREVQPQARALIGGPVVKIETMSSYSCRNAYGRTKTRLSEHAKANAIDIGGFGMGKDAVYVLASWGPTERELRAIAAKREAERAAAAAAAAQSGAKGPMGNLPQPVPQAPQPSVGTLTGVPGVVIPGPGAQPSFGLAPTRLGGPAPKDGKQQVLPTLPSAPKVNDAKSQFLRNIHSSACRYFGTVLGPEANNAHKNHFHLDMAQRNRGNFCE